MTVKDSKTVDYISKSDDGTSMSMIMVEDRPLDTPGIVNETVDKVNTYLAFLRDGQLEGFDEDAKNAKVRVQYNVLDDPKSSPELMDVLAEAGEMFTKEGVEFRVRHFNFLDESIEATGAG
jgi:hypothetical protein